MTNNSPDNRAKLARHIVNGMTEEQLREWLFQDLYDRYQNQTTFNSDWEDNEDELCDS